MNRPFKSSMTKTQYWNFHSFNEYSLEDMPSHMPGNHPRNPQLYTPYPHLAKSLLESFGINVARALPLKMKSHVKFREPMIETYTNDQDARNHAGLGGRIIQIGNNAYSIRKK